MTDYDVAIIGGGLAGLSLAILLGQQGWTVVCIDKGVTSTHIDKNYDIRTTAISWGSRNLLKHAGIWSLLEDKSQCISRILIKDEDSPIDLDFNAIEIGEEGFGWIVDNRDLRLALLEKIKDIKTITHKTGHSVNDFKHNKDTVSVKLENGLEMSARLVIGADGRNSFTRDSMGIGTWQKDYKQCAIVCLIEHEKSHQGLALEHFRSQGPFAVLPFTDTLTNKHRSAIVWTVDQNEADKWLQCSNEVFNAALQTRCGNLYGSVTVSGGRAAWPLTLNKAYKYIDQRMALVAEAAHGIHPIAGQGLNMSLRDIAALTELLKDAKDPGDANILSKYQKLRMGDNLSMAIATDGLNALFGLNIPAIRALRRFGLHTVSRLPFAKKIFMKQAMGAVGHLPKLIKKGG